MGYFLILAIDRVAARAYYGHGHTKAYYGHDHKQGNPAPQNISVDLLKNQNEDEPKAIEMLSGKPN